MKKTIIILSVFAVSLYFTSCNESGKESGDKVENEHKEGDGHEHKETEDHTEGDHKHMEGDGHDHASDSLSGDSTKQE